MRRRPSRPSSLHRRVRSGSPEPCRRGIRHRADASQKRSRAVRSVSLGLAMRFWAQPGDNLPQRVGTCSTVGRVGCAEFVKIVPLLAALAVMQPSRGWAAEPENGDRTPPATASSSGGRPLGPMGWSGIAALSVGAGGLVGGAVLFARGERTLSAPGQIEQRVQDLRPAGIAVLSVSGAVLLGGAILLGLDRRRARRVSVGFGGGPDGLALRLGGRF